MNCETCFSGSLVPGSCSNCVNILVQQNQDLQEKVKILEQLQDVERKIAEIKLQKVERELHEKNNAMQAMKAQFDAAIFPLEKCPKNDFGSPMKASTPKTIRTNITKFKKSTAVVRPFLSKIPKWAAQTQI